MKYSKNADIFGTLMTLVGIILIFVSFWAEGYNILRFFATAIALIIWGNGIQKNQEYIQEIYGNSEEKNKPNKMQTKRKI